MSTELTATQIEAKRVLAALEAAGEFQDPTILDAVARFKERFTALAAGTETQELTPERAATLAALKANHERLAHLSNGVTWADAEKALRANPAEIDKLTKLLQFRPNSDLTLTGRENGEIMFEEVAPDCPGIKNITYDKKAQILAEESGKRCEGNAVDVAASFGTKPMAWHRYETLRGKVPGLDQRTLAWLLTDVDTRKTGQASYGEHGIVEEDRAHARSDDWGVRLALGVKEA